MKIILIALLLLPIYSVAQLKYEFDSEKFTYTIIDSTNESKADLYTKARVFIANVFVSAKDVIQMEDKEAGKIIAKGLFKIEGAKGTFGNHLGYDNIWFTINIDVKNSKYRCVLSNYRHEGGSYTGSTSGGMMDQEIPSCGRFLLPLTRWNKFKARAKEQSVEMIEQFKVAMSKPVPSSEF